MAQASVKKRIMDGSEQLVLLNSKGELVRVIAIHHLDGSAVEAKDPVTVVFRHDKRRVEAHVDVAVLKADGVLFDVLAETTPKELNAKPLSIGVLGKLTWMSVESATISPTHEMAEEDDKRDLILAGKWIGGVQVALILVIMILGHFINKEMKKDEVVTTIRPVEMEKIAKVEPPPVVKMAKELPKQVTHVPRVKKVVKQEVKRPQPRIVTRNAPKTQTRPVTARIPKTAPALESLGALGALGGVSKKMQSGGGLNLNGSSLARGGDRGAGGGGVGSGGAGGVAGALFGKGLIAASNGSGARAGSAGGYGTKGRGGGREGYGTRNMLGASGGYVAPLDSESFIEGGLTREQVEEVIMRNMGLITACYEKGLQIEPSLRGRVAVSFVIGSGGQVATARVQHSSVESRQLEGCIVGRLKGFKFPRPVAGVNVQVQYPFSFRRVSSIN